MHGDRLERRTVGCTERTVADSDLDLRGIGAGEPIEPALLAAASGIEQAEVRRHLLRWRALIEFDDRVRFYHTTTRVFVAERTGAGLARAHAAYVALARERSGGQLQNLSISADSYLVRQIARMGGDCSAFVPPAVVQALRERFGRSRST